MSLKTVDLSQIVENPFNPRNLDTPLERAKLQYLADSIARNVMLNPPVLYRVRGTKKWAPISGHRRIMAARVLGWSTIRCNTTADIGLPLYLGDKEALGYILEDQEVTNPFNNAQKVRTAEVTGWQSLPQNPKWDSLDKERAQCPRWLWDLFAGGDKPKLAFTVIQKIRICADQLESLADRDDTMHFLANKMLSREWSTRQPLRVWGNWAKANPAQAASQIRKAMSQAVAD